MVNYFVTAFIQFGSLQETLFSRYALVISSIGRSELTFSVDLINFSVEYINADHVITCCLLIFHE